MISFAFALFQRAVRSAWFTNGPIQHAVRLTWLAIGSIQRALRFTSFAIGSIPRAVRFTSFAIGSIPRALRFTSFAIDSIPRALRFTSFAIGLIQRALRRAPCAIHRIKQAVCQTVFAVSRLTPTVHPSASATGPFQLETYRTTFAIAQLEPMVDLIELAIHRVQLEGRSPHPADRGAGLYDSQHRAAAAWVRQTTHLVHLGIGRTDWGKTHLAHLEDIRTTRELWNNVADHRSIVAIRYLTRAIRCPTRTIRCPTTMAARKILAYQPTSLRYRRHTRRFQ